MNIEIYKDPLEKTLKNKIKKIKFALSIKRYLFTFFNFYKHFIKILNLIKINKLCRFGLINSFYYDLSVFKYYLTKNVEYYLVTSKDPQISKAIVSNNNDRNLQIKRIENFKKICVKKNHKITNIIDVGASIGNVIIPAINRKIFERGIAYEPVKENFKLLKINTILNNLEDFIEINQYAIGDKDDLIVEIEISKYDVGDHRIRYGEYKGLFNEQLRQIDKVKSNTLDSLLKNVQMDTFAIWLNNQGSEAHTISGAKNILKKYKNPLFLEFSPYYIKNSNSFKLLKNTLIEVGYKNVFNCDNENKIGEVEEEFFDEEYSKLGEKGNYTNYIIT